MNERPEPERLLAEARRTLLEGLLPSLDEAGRYQARMIANALGIVARQAEAGDAAWAELEAALRGLTGRPEADLEALLPAVARALREGRWDGDERLHAALHAFIRARVAVANPKALPRGN